MIGLFSAALPEFLGSLCATLVVAIGTWMRRKARSRTATRDNQAAARDNQTTPADE